MENAKYTPPPQSTKGYSLVQNKKITKAGQLTLFVNKTGKTVTKMTTKGISWKTILDTVAKKIVFKSFEKSALHFSAFGALFHLTVNSE